MTAAFPKPKRGWFQYRLRTLLIITAIIAIALGWWSYKARQQREAVAALRLIGASVEYDTTLPWTSGMKNPPKWPKWLLDQGSVDYLGSVQKLVIHNTQVTNAGLEQLKSLTALEYLHLNTTQVTDAGLEHLKNLTGLKRLYLNYTQVTDAGLEHLRGLTALQELSLDNTQVTDAGLEHLKHLTALDRLYIVHTKVTDAGVARLQKSLPNCEIYH